MHIQGIDSTWNRSYLVRMQRRKGSTCNTLGGLLRRARAARRMTLRAVASAAGVSFGFLADVELGRRNASEDVLTRIAEALGADVNAVLRASARLRIAATKARAEEYINSIRETVR